MQFGEEIRLGVGVKNVLRRRKIPAFIPKKLRKRDERDNLIFRRRFLRGEKQKTIAAALGLSASSISRRCQYVAAVFVNEYNKARKND